MTDREQQRVGHSGLLVRLVSILAVFAVWAMVLFL